MKKILTTLFLLLTAIWTWADESGTCGDKLTRKVMVR